MCCFKKNIKILNSYYLQLSVLSSRTCKQLHLLAAVLLSEIVSLVSYLQSDLFQISLPVEVLIETLNLHFTIPLFSYINADPRGTFVYVLPITNQVLN